MNASVTKSTAKKSTFWNALLFYHACQPKKLWNTLSSILVKKTGSDQADVQNYRLISNLTFMSKVVECLVCRQLVACLEQNGVLPELQSTCRRGRSTKTAIVRLLLFSLGCGSWWCYIPQSVRPIRCIRHCWPRHSHHQVAWLIRSSRYSSVVDQQLHYWTHAEGSCWQPIFDVLGSLLWSTAGQCTRCTCPVPPVHCWCAVMVLVLIRTPTTLSCTTLVIWQLRSDFCSSDVVYRRCWSLDVVKITESQHWKKHSLLVLVCDISLPRSTCPFS